ncbi:MAG: hypothetical protein M3R17_18605 [Bacteroidota bacterium]|nr:hypothetical protein [Bacteroidota bacterium]
MMRRVLILLVAFSCFSGGLLAQKDKKKNKQEESWLENAEYYFSEKNYLRALPYYQKLSQAHDDNAYFHLQLGICYLHKKDQKELAIVELEKAKSQEPEIERIDFYLGQAYHLNYFFDKAIAQFNLSLSNDNLNEKEQLEIKHYIDFCVNGIILCKDTAAVEIKNAGDPINTQNAEYVPVITIDESTLIFTYRGEKSTGGLLDLKFNPDSTGDYYEDIMVSERVGDHWQSPEPISNNINTKGHDATVALSNDGQMLFIFKSTTQDGGDIFVSMLNGSTWSTPERLGANINTPKNWEGSCSLSSDGNILYFASDRPGGLGGRDIYFSRKQPDGQWGPAENMGPGINTVYNDDSPFIHPDGINLFFSSEGHTSMGGYDLFYTTYKNGKWKVPVNLGFPINTPSSERFYTLTADGGTGYYSSDQKGGFGQQDIYTVSPGFQGEPPILALVVGFITLDGNPVDAKINVSDSANGNIYANYHSNGSSGKYLIALRPGNTYKVAIEVEGADAYFEYVNVKSLDTYVQIDKDFNFVSSQVTTSSGDTIKRVQPQVADSNDVLQKKLDKQIKQIKEEQNDVVYEQRMYKQIMKKYGDRYDSSLSYVVELGTYENPKDFDSTLIEDMGALKREVVTPEGYIRYSIGPFKTLLDAELFRSQIARRDSTIASNSEVIVYKDGKRETIPSLYRADYKRKDYIPREDTRVVRSIKGTLITTTGTDYGYDKIVQDYGTFQADGLTYKLEIASVTDTNDFRLQYFAKYGTIEKKTYPDGTIRYYLGPWNTLKEAEEFKADLIKKDSAAIKSLVTVFYFGTKKTVPEFFKDPPCNNDPVDLTYFKNRSLNDPAVYQKFLAVTGNHCADGIIYKVQIGAYRKPENFKYPQLEKEYGKGEIIPYPDGITRFTMKEFKTIQEAEVFRQECIRKGIKDAWITAVYKGERKTLEELIANDFFGKAIQ